MVTNLLERFKRVKGKCSAQLPEVECASVAVNNMNPRLREKLIVIEYSDLAQLSCKASRMEQFIVEQKQRRTSRAEPRGCQLVVVVEYDLAKEEVNDEERIVQGEIMAAELLGASYTPIPPSLLLKERRKSKLRKRKHIFFVFQRQIKFLTSW